MKAEGRCAAVQDLISMFNDNELELLISGLPDIDVEDLRANTEYQNYSPASPVIQYFWEVVRELDREDLALLVQFVTGTSKVPLDGFEALQVGALCDPPNTHPPPWTTCLLLLLAPALVRWEWM